jgi:hypothetical protein
VELVGKVLDHTKDVKAFGAVVDVVERADVVDKLLPSGPRMLATTTQMDHLRLDADGRSLLVEIHRSKTSLFRERFRIIRIMGSSDVNLCIVRAFAAVRNATAFRRPKFLADLDVGLDSFAKFVGVLQDVIPARASTTHEKGVVSGHSPRRSFTKIAMERGVPLQSIMVFGDWGSRGVRPQFLRRGCYSAIDRNRTGTE